MDPRIIAALSRPDLSPSRRLEARVSLIQYGEIGAAVTQLARLTEVPVLKPKVAALLARCRELKALEIESRAVSSGSRPRDGAGEEDGFWSAPAGSETTVLAFTGNARRVGVSMYFFHRVLQAHHVNAVFMFDWKNAYFLKGVGGLGDSLQQTASNLRRMLGEMGTKRLICLGQSSGGYAAIRYGVELRADAIIAVSPTILQPMSGAPLGRIRAAVGAEVDPADLDLRVLLSQRSPTPRTWLVFGEGCVSDVRSAQHLAGLAGVVQQAVPGFDKHAILAPLVVSGEFSSLFARICKEIGPGRWRADSARQ